MPFKIINGTNTVLTGHFHNEVNVNVTYCFLSVSKVAPLFQDRTLGRPSAVGSIFDEGSREGSENSLADEACRARRQFLKSGLPDSFKKLIVKTEATMEAYSLSCSSFHPVVHVLQTPQGTASPSHQCSSLPQHSSLTYTGATDHKTHGSNRVTVFESRVGSFSEN